eukprot:TRINITY_DN4481_c0_g1_i2.p1 TRINITY_DN4481_c0_g1~~TRINITY_DN4481_c0_g1_i2.p1  ORF type:complete len:367 (-),score=57.62 TRINITY_DN4481_c0_g1_i2:319-1377(-)
MSFIGTQSKCKVCTKTVYPMEQLTVEGCIYHKACFRCAHCKATVNLNNYSAIEGVPYCKPHYEQLFKQTGSYTRSFQGAIQAEKQSTPPPESVTASAVVKATEKKASAPSPWASKFGGTQDKCKVCSKTVYPLEKISVETVTYHKHCFRCVHSNCSLTTSNYTAINGQLYCKHHYNQLFMLKGSYNTISGTEGAAAAAPAAGGAAAKADAANDEEGAAVAAAAAGVAGVAVSSAAVAASPATGPSKAAAASASKPAAKKKADSDSDSDDSDDSDDDDSDDDKPASKPAAAAPPARSPAPAAAAAPTPAPAATTPAPAAKSPAPAAAAAKEDDSDDDSDEDSDDSDDSDDDSD